MRLKLALLFSLLAVPAFADSTSGSQSGAWSQSGVQINHANGHRPVGAAIAPGLIAGGITCLGSVSVGSGFVGGGLGIGMTYPDRSCNAREDAKYMLLLGSSKAAAKERLCDIRRVRNAYAASGDPCIRDRARVTRTSTARTASFGYTRNVGYAKSARETITNRD